MNHRCGGPCRGPVIRTGAYRPDHRLAEDPLYKWVTRFLIIGLLSVICYYSLIDLISHYYGA